MGAISVPGFAVDTPEKRDYCGHMITNLKEAKATLSALVASAAGGADVVITVHGRPAARLTGIPAAGHGDMTRWRRELESLHRKYGTGRSPEKGRSVLDIIREERT